MLGELDGMLGWLRTGAYNGIGTYFIYTSVVIFLRNEAKNLAFCIFARLSDIYFFGAEVLLHVLDLLIPV
jgi:hypothetical protein